MKTRNDEDAITAQSQAIEQWNLEIKRFSSKEPSSASTKSRSRKTEIYELAFRQEIDRLIFKAWSKGHHGFKSLLLNLPGVYPTEVLLSLRRLRSAKQIIEFDVLAVELEAASKPIYNVNPVSPSERKIEHPLDF